MEGGDQKEKFTYIGLRGCLATEFVITVHETKGEIKTFKIKEGIESDHMPQSWYRAAEQEEKGRRSRRKQIKTEEGKILFRERMDPL